MIHERQGLCAELRHAHTDIPRDIGDPAPRKTDLLVPASLLPLPAAVGGGAGVTCGRSGSTSETGVSEVSDA